MLMSNAVCNILLLSRLLILDRNLEALFSSDVFFLNYLNALQGRQMVIDIVTFFKIGDGGIPCTGCIAGRKGVRGEPGNDGLQGLQGDRGLPGDPGAAGIQGDDGQTGKTGRQGDPVCILIFCIFFFDILKNLLYLLNLPMPMLMLIMLNMVGQTDDQTEKI